MARNMLKCVVTDVERITNKSYLKKRLAALDISEEKFRKYYISKTVTENLALSVRKDGLRDTAYALGYSQNDVIKLLTYNGKNRTLLKSLWEADGHPAWEELPVPQVKQSAVIRKDNAPVDKVLDMDYSITT